MNTKLKVILIALLTVTLTYPVQGTAVSSPQLKAKYLEYNEEYFLGMLPTDAIVGYGTCAEDAMACTTHPEDIFQITLVKEYNLAPAQAYENLLHESCHLVTWSELDEHGPRFKDCMRRIYALGAFDGIL